jgi:hypothetical protein
MTPIVPTRYLSPADIAERFGVDVHKVLAWLRSGELRGIDVSARRGAKPRWRINPADLAAFEAARACTKTPEPARRRRKPDTGIIPYF